MMLVEIGKVPALDAIENIRSKLAIPTKAWDDLLDLPRGKAFTVAGATKLDLLNDLQEGIARALENGETISGFRKRFDQVVQKHGWTYNGKRGWRTRVIYDNNLRSAQMAGRWQQMQRTKRTRPYLVYMTVGDSRVRQQHQAWHKVALPIDDAFWSTHFPPNGWGCRCSAMSANERQLKKLGIEPAVKAPAKKPTERVSATTGEYYGMVPEGIDVGWNHNVGQQWLGPDTAFGEKVMALNRDTRRAALANDGIHFEKLSKSFSLWAAKSLREKGQNKLHSVGWLQDEVIEALAKRDIKPKTATLSISDTRLKRMQRDLKRQKNINMPIEVLHQLPAEIKNAQAVLLDKKGALVYVLRKEFGNKTGKVIVAVNFREAGELTNSVRSGGMAEIGSLRDKKQYEVLTGKL